MHSVEITGIEVEGEIRIGAIRLNLVTATMNVAGDLFAIAVAKEFGLDVLIRCELYANL
jgi:hypothetical protein